MTLPAKKREAQREGFLEVFVTREVDGYIYYLGWDAKDSIKKNFSDKSEIQFNRIFVEQNMKKDFKTQIEPIYEHVLPLITNISTKKLKEKFQGVKFIDFKFEEELDSIQF
jgi:hypothetical protein